MGRRREERFKSNLVIRVGQGYGTLRDLSASGIYFTTDQSLALGERISFSMEFETSPRGPLVADCEARVIRLEPQAAVNGVAAALTDIQFRRAAEF